MDDKTLAREIEALVAVEPAPEFRARLRQRIAEEPHLDGARAFWRPSWRLVTAAALVTASVIGVVLLRMSSQPPATELAARSVEAFSYTQPVALAVPARVPGPAPSGRTIAASQMGVTSNMEVIVDPVEVAAWHRLLTDIGTGRMEVSVVVRAAHESPAPLPDEFVLPPVTIEPLTPEFREQGVHP